MKTKYFFLIILLAVLMPLIFEGQTSNNSGALLELLKGDGAFEKWFMEVFTKLDTQINNNIAGARMLGQSIGGLGALMYLGYLGWQMQEGARPWEVTPMIRPIVIGLILFHWTGFTSMIQYPLQALAQPSQTIFNQIEEDANDLRIKRFEKQTQLLDFLIKKRAEEEAKEEALQSLESGSDTSWIEEGMDELISPIKEWFIRMDFKLQKLTAEILEAVSLTILRVCVYLIFFIQKIWAYILITLGPIAVGMALIPGFESSLYSWVAKFININLYTFVAYTIINIGQQLIMAGYQMEIDRYDLMITNGSVTDLDTLQIYISNNGMIHTVLFPCVAFIVTGIGVLMTPTIADSIVSAGGAGVMSKVKSGAMKMAGATTTIAKTIGV
ncbi:hypothetical protein [Cloacibacterium normanense]|uniref:hypothetical protein n=1 Tax=Cloacibacterium normanense TaxID=237258 RepID=UPI0039199F92